jgi:IS30 family transposase
MAKQLNMEEREGLAQMRFAGRTRSEIAQALGRHLGTMGRELARDSEADGSYLASRA